MHNHFFLILCVFLLLGCSLSEEDLRKPDDSRFTPSVLINDLDEPMAFEVMNNGDVLIAERKGALKRYDAANDSVYLVKQIDVTTKYTSRDGTMSESEEGFMGLALDPNYEKNNWVYLYFSHPTESTHVLTRWVFKDNVLDASSKKTVLSIPVQREICCHTGGGMVWDQKGNLYLTVGNNTANSFMAHSDERPGRENWDDQGRAANTNDLRGKILRIHPEDDGTYSIPKGNLFEEGTPGTRPEIYTMGHRNPWRVSIDNKTGFLYWGEVGPDANEDSEIGPRGYDELNQARKPGNFGWPFFVGPNKPFPYYDFEEGKPHAFKDPANYTNNSVNNTGLELLPPLAPAFIYYPYRASEEFPLVGSGARSATGGPIFRKFDFSKQASGVFPSYYEGKWFVTDFSRGWIMTVSMTREGDYQSMEPFLPSYQPVGAIDMKFGPQGDLYILEYDSNWFKKSSNSMLVKISYNGFNRPPVAQAGATRKGGQVPFEAQLTAQGSSDPDGDKLAYEWSISDASGRIIETFTDHSPVVRLGEEGVFAAKLTVTDPNGERSTHTIHLLAGNAEPNLNLVMHANRTFFFPGQEVNYQVNIVDEEDGTVGAGINPADVLVGIQYTTARFDSDDSELLHQQSPLVHFGQPLMAKNNCFNCHSTDQQSLAPSLVDISNTYKHDEGAADRLAHKIINGGNGVWGTAMMPANPGISLVDSRTITDYILSITETQSQSLPVSGSFVTAVPEGDDGRGSYLLWARYHDKEHNGAPSHVVQDISRLRSPFMAPHEATSLIGTHYAVAGIGGDIILKPKHGTVLVYRGVDMTGVKSIRLDAEIVDREGNAGGKVELRADSAHGELLGSLHVNTFVPPSLPSLPTVEQLSHEKGISIGKASQLLEQLTVERAAAVTPPEPLVLLNKDLTDFTDLFFVFKNDEAKDTQTLFTVRGFLFNGGQETHRHNIIGITKE